MQTLSDNGRERIAFVTTGYFPVPPVQGGAVESLVYSLVKSNENDKAFQFTVFSSFDKKAVATAKQVYTNFQFFKNPILLKLMDKLIYFIVRKMMKKTKVMSYRYISQRLWYLVKVAWRIRRENYDYIVIENAPINFLIFKLFGNRKKYDGKYGLHLHNQVGKAFGCEQLIENSECLIGISQFINKSFLRKFPNYDHRYVELKNCVVEEKEKPVDVRRLLRIPKKNILVLFSGRLTSEKGALELIDAFCLLPKADLTLVMIGGYYYKSGMKTAYEDQLKKHAKGSKNQIIFTGYIDHNELGSYYDAADMAVFPSMWDEPAGLTVIEAMRHALPVITTSNGGIPEYVGRDNVVIIDSAGDVTKKLAEKIMFLKSHVQFGQELGKRAKIRSNRFNEQRYYSDFSQIIMGRTKR